MDSTKDFSATWREPFLGAPSDRVAAVVRGLVSHAATRGSDALAGVALALARGPREGALEIASDAGAFGCDDDAAAAWLWVAAASGSPEAVERMGSLVAARDALAAAPRPRADVDMSLFATGPTPTTPTDPVHFKGLHFLDDVAVRARRTVPSDGKVVIPFVGDPDSKDGVALARRYASVVGRVLPMSGRVPAPGIVYRSVVERWPWAERAASEVERHLAMLRLSRSEAVRLPPLLFVGRPGCGKSTVARHVCETLGLDTEILSCAGVGDSGSLAPVARGWTNHAPGLFARAVLRTRLANPAFVLDEIDKSPPVDGRNGSAQGVLLGVLGVRRADAYQDSCLLGPVDVTSMTVVATANSLAPLDRALLDRFQVVRIDEPRDRDFGVLLRNARRDFAAENDMDAHALPTLTHAQVTALRGFLSAYRSARKFREAYGCMVKDAAWRDETGRSTEGVSPTVPTEGAPDIQ